MKLGIRGKLFLFSLVLDLLLIGQIGFSLESTLRDRLERKLHDRLERFAETARVSIVNHSGSCDILEMDGLADALGGAMRERITIIARNGMVLGDSELTPDQIEEVENHGDRLEVREAIAGRTGYYRRYSDTLNTEMVYLALPFEHQRGAGVVRVAISLAEVRLTVNEQRRTLLVASLLALVLAVFLTGLALDFLTRTFRELVEQAEQLTRNIGQPRIIIRSKDEIGGLAHSFNFLANRLEETVMELAQDRSRMNAVLQGMSEGVIGLDSERRVTLINEPACTLLGIDTPKKGQPIEDAIPLEAIQKSVQAAENNTFCTMDFDLIAPSQKCIQVIGSSMKSSGGCILVLRDVTRERHAERLLRDFVANVSHELRTPAHALLINAELLRECAVEQEPRLFRLSSAIERNAQRLSRIIGHLLFLSRLDDGRQYLNIRKVPLRPLITATIERMKDAARTSEISLESRIERGAMIETDPELFSEVVLFNLFENAFKYCESGTRVTVGLRQMGDSYRLEVSDNGPGVPPQHQKHLFERFYRVDDSRSRKLGSTGLGLAIVQSLVEKLGGLVGMEPVLPHGCLFWIKLPITIEDPQGSSPPTPPAPD